MKGDNQKLKMLYLVKIFSEETDDEHGLTIPEIQTRLEGYGVNADRKTLYQDFDLLRDFGLDIITTRSGRNHYYHLGSRDFEIPELKLLVDSVQSAKFITDKKSGELIHKLESLVSKYQGKQLQRQVIIAGRVKTMNESIYYNVDKIHDAIGDDRQIRFHYFDWNLEKEMVPRNDGMWYQVSPWALMWDDEKYYLVAYDENSEMVRHYRVDKMMDIGMLDEPREGKEDFAAFNMPQYTTSMFGMFGGETMAVRLEGENSRVGVIIDRFGKDIIIVPVDENHFQTTVRVAVSKHFLGWIMSLDGIKIVGPPSVVTQMEEMIAELAAEYDVLEKLDRRQ